MKPRLISSQYNSGYPHVRIDERPSFLLLSFSIPIPVILMSHFPIPFFLKLLPCTLHPLVFPLLFRPECPAMGVTPQFLLEIINVDGLACYLMTKLAN